MAQGYQIKGLVFIDAIRWPLSPNNVSPSQLTKFKIHQASVQSLLNPYSSNDTTNRHFYEGL